MTPSNSLMPSNKLPDQYLYEDIRPRFTEMGQYRIKAGNNTFVQWNFQEETITLHHYNQRLATLHPDGSVDLDGSGLRTSSNADRMSRAVARHGMSVMVAVPSPNQPPVVVDFYWLISGPLPTPGKRWKGVKFDDVLTVMNKEQVQR